MAKSKKWNSKKNLDYNKYLPLAVLAVIVIIAVVFMYKPEGTTTGGNDPVSDGEQLGLFWVQDHPLIEIESFNADTGQPQDHFELGENMLIKIYAKGMSNVHTIQGRVTSLSPELMIANVEKVEDETVPMGFHSASKYPLAGFTSETPDIFLITAYLEQYPTGADVMEKTIIAEMTLPINANPGTNRAIEFTFDVSDIAENAILDETHPDGNVLTGYFNIMAGSETCDDTNPAICTDAFKCKIEDGGCLPGCNGVNTVNYACDVDPVDSNVKCMDTETPCTGGTNAACVAGECYWCDDSDITTCQDSQNSCGLDGCEQVCDGTDGYKPQVCGLTEGKPTCEDGTKVMCDLTDTCTDGLCSGDCQENDVDDVTGMSMYRCEDKNHEYTPYDCTQLLVFDTNGEVPLYGWNTGATWTTYGCDGANGCTDSVETACINMKYKAGCLYNKYSTDGLNPLVFNPTTGYITTPNVYLGRACVDLIGDVGDGARNYNSIFGTDMRDAWVDGGDVLDIEKIVVRRGVGCDDFGGLELCYADVNGDEKINNLDVTAVDIARRDFNWYKLDSNYQPVCAGGGCLA